MKQKTSLDRQRSGHSLNMTFDKSKLLKSLPALMLAPLLAAPRGCHFGSDQVPLGENPEEEAGGAGSGDDAGTNPASGGSGAGYGGTASRDGGVTGGFGGSVSTGGNAAADAGGRGGDAGTTDLPCLETYTPLANGEDTPLGFSAFEVHDLLRRRGLGAHRAPVTLENMPPTNVTLQLLGPIDLFYVEAELNPNLPPEDGYIFCENHVRAKTYARLISDDGLFDETFPEYELVVLPAFDTSATSRHLVAMAGIELPLDELRGTYHRERPNDGACLQGLQFNLDIHWRESADPRSEGEFNGTLVERFVPEPLLDVSCFDPQNIVHINQRGSWQCAGNSNTCRAIPTDTIVVEAESCDRFGAQITQGGDETTFSRDDNVITRAETWGCGCPMSPEHVLAYSPASPLELRLCHDDLADSCEAACGRPLSYDLSRAFARARTTEFRFVD